MRRRTARTTTTSRARTTTPAATPRGPGSRISSRTWQSEAYTTSSCGCEGLRRKAVVSLSCCGSPWSLQHAAVPPAQVDKYAAHLEKMTQVMKREYTLNTRGRSMDVRSLSEKATGLGEEVTRSVIKSRDFTRSRMAGASVRVSAVRLSAIAEDAATFNAPPPSLPLDDEGELCPAGDRERPANWAELVAAAAAAAKSSSLTVSKLKPTAADDYLMAETVGRRSSARVAYATLPPAAPAGAAAAAVAAAPVAFPPAAAAASSAPVAGPGIEAALAAVALGGGKEGDDDASALTTTRGRSRRNPHSTSSSATGASASAGFTAGEKH